jgi:pimeloyl-ACP methyl ester carboxylesterase
MPVAYDLVGSGPALVLLHPLGADRHVWDPIVPALSAQRTVVTLDLPGFGAAPPLTATPPSPRALAAAVARVLSELGIERPHVAGNSLGGWVALELGLAGAVASVTAIAPAGLWPAPLVAKASIAHRLAKALRPAAVSAVSTRAGRRVLLASAMAHPERMPAADAVQLVGAYARAPGFIAVNDAMRAGRFTELDRLRVPVTLVWPDRDQLIERPLSIRAAVRNVVLTDAGHVPMWDAPEQLAAVLLETSAALTTPPSPSPQEPARPADAGGSAPATPDSTSSP